MFRRLLSACILAEAFASRRLAGDVDDHDHTEGTGSGEPGVGCAAGMEVDVYVGDEIGKKWSDEGPYDIAGTYDIWERYPGGFYYSSIDTVEVIVSGCR